MNGAFCKAHCGGVGRNTFGGTKGKEEESMKANGILDLREKGEALEEGGL